jgi:RPA family protein
MMHTRAALEATENMATSNSQSQQGATVPDREVAKLVFAAELNEATYTFKTAQNERAPVYVALPTGERANRVCVMGTATDVEDVGTDDQEYFRVRIVDPTGTFWVYAGQYQHEALKRLKKIEPPEFLTVIGKPRTYKTDDGTINVSLVPEDVGIVDVSTRDIWVFEAARRTLERVESARETSPKVAALAREQYGHNGSYFAHVAALALQNLLDGDESSSSNGEEAIEERLEEAEAKDDDVNGEEPEQEKLIED